MKFLELCIGIERSGATGLAQCLQKLEDMVERDEVASASGKADAVTLMTIHKAKGLEYPLSC